MIEDITLEVKEEQLEIAKKWIQTGEVSIHKEITTEEKTFIIPLVREELVIQKKTLGADIQKHGAAYVETIRIPLSEEKVEFAKQTVVLEEISIYKEQIEEIRRVEEKLKREKLKVKGSELKNN